MMPIDPLYLRIIYPSTILAETLFDDRVLSHYITEGVLHAHRSMCLFFQYRL